MAEKTLIRQAVDDSGLKISYIAKKLDISRPTLYKRFQDPSLFTGQEIKELCKMLQLDTAGRNRIFFG